MIQVIKRDSLGIYYLDYIPEEGDEPEVAETQAEPVQTDPEPESEEEMKKKNAFGLDMKLPKAKKPRVRAKKAKKPSLMAVPKSVTGMPKLKPFGKSRGI